MQKALCTTLLAAGMASADLLTIEVDGIADPASGVRPALPRHRHRCPHGSNRVASAVQSTTISMAFGGEGTSGASQGSVTGPSYQGGWNIDHSFTGSFDWADVPLVLAEPLVMLVLVCEPART